MPELGLSVRWSLADAPPGVLQTLADYVRDTSYDRFSALDGLAFKTWRARQGAWFEGCYVFATEAARQAFQDDFARTAATAPGSRIIGSAPILIEACEVVAVAEGAAGFAPSPAYVEVATQ